MSQGNTCAFQSQQAHCLHWSSRLVPGKMARRRHFSREQRQWQCYPKLRGLVWLLLVVASPAFARLGMKSSSACPRPDRIRGS